MGSRHRKPLTDTPKEPKNAAVSAEPTTPILACPGYLEPVYHSHGDFMQRFPLGRFAREHFLKLLGFVMNDIKHNFVDTVYAENSVVEGCSSGFDSC
ncbi:hypothetical protein SO802_009794 [Lithocarpus litseifolius]|uniref:Uncharacterized protein n=1 Tax=Lithocarpus litseifolius TaxID=425828 RepID=A0AAW2DCY8_9ROSI